MVLEIFLKSATATGSSSKDKVMGLCRLCRRSVSTSTLSNLRQYLQYNHATDAGVKSLEAQSKLDKTVADRKTLAAVEDVREYMSKTVAKEERNMLLATYIVKDLEALGTVESSNLK